MVLRSSSSRSSAAGLTPDAGTRVCVLYGTEQMLMRLHVEALRKALESEHGPFQTIRFDGKSATLADVFDELHSQSLLEAYKLVVLDDAEPFVTAHRQALERYVQNPAAHATLVLRSQRWHRGKLDKLIEKVGCVIKCEPLPAARAQAWSIQRAKDFYQCTLGPAAAKVLVDRLGCDLMQLDNELAKLAVTVSTNNIIELAHIQRAVKRGGDEQAWAIQEAILGSFTTTGPGRAIEKIHDLIDRSGQADVLVAYFVADLIRKLFLGSMMRRQGSSDQQIAERFKLWGARRGLFMTCLTRLDEQAVSRLFDQVVRMDARAKTGRGSPIRNLECFCCGLTGKR